MSGKGDRPRPVNKKKYDKNFKSIFKRLTEDEVHALHIVVMMAEGNLYCRRTDERKRAIDLVKGMIK